MKNEKPFGCFGFLLGLIGLVAIVFFVIKKIGEWSDHTRKIRGEKFDFDPAKYIKDIPKTDGFNKILKQAKKFSKMVQEEMEKEKQVTSPKKKELQFEVKERKHDLTPRQEIIFELIKKKRKVGVKDIMKLVEGVSNRTIRRDLQRLCELELIKKNGRTKDVHYLIK